MGVRGRKLPVRLAFVPVLLACLASLALIAPAANALSPVRVTGGFTKLFAPIGGTLYLETADPAARFYVQPVGYSGIYLNVTRFGQYGNEVRFNIGGGELDADTMLGLVNHPNAGIRIVRYQQAEDGIWRPNKELLFTALRIFNGNMLLGDALGLAPAPSSNIVETTSAYDASTGNIHFTGRLEADAAGALILNTFFSTTIFTANMTMGYLTSDIKTRPVI